MNLNSPTLVFDMDYIKYTVAAAGEKRDIVAIHKQSGDEFVFKARTEFWGRDKKSGWLAETNATRETPHLVTDFDIIDRQTPPPISHSCRTVKAHIKNILEKLGSNRYYGYLGKGDSWRVDRSTILKYKGQREVLLKPLNIPEVEQYLLKNHASTFVTHLEADDQCVIDCTAARKAEKQFVLVGVDKDYYGCEVDFFNVDKMESPLSIRGLGQLEVETKANKTKKVNGSGRIFFYFQVASGDTTDNYKANSASDLTFGPMSAYHVLKDCKTDKEALMALRDIYWHLYPSPKTITGWRGDTFEIDWKYVLRENWDMARMLRWEGDKVDPILVMQHLGIDIDDPRPITITRGEAE